MRLLDWMFGVERAAAEERPVEAREIHVIADEPKALRVGDKVGREQVALIVERPFEGGPRYSIVDGGVVSWTGRQDEFAALLRKAARDASADVFITPTKVRASWSEDDSMWPVASRIRPGLVSE